MDIPLTLKIYQELVWSLPSPLARCGCCLCVSPPPGHRTMHLGPPSSPFTLLLFQHQVKTAIGVTSRLRLHTCVEQEDVDDMRHICHVPKDSTALSVNC